MTAALLAGLVAGYGIAVPVGAVAPLLVALTARTSWRVGASAALGVATVDFGYALIVVGGGGVLARVIAPIGGPLRWIAAAVLVVIGGRVMVSALRSRSVVTSDRDVPVVGAWRAYLRFVGLTAINPTTVGYFAALVVGGRSAVLTGWAPDIVFVAAVLIASASWQLLLAGGGALLGRALTGPRGRRATGLISGVLIIALAIRLAAA